MGRSADDPNQADRSSEKTAADGSPVDGVDVTLIDEMLAMSVEDRLRQNDRMVETVAQLRQAMSRAG